MESYRENNRINCTYLCKRDFRKYDTYSKDAVMKVMGHRQVMRIGTFVFEALVSLLRSFSSSTVAFLPSSYSLSTQDLHFYKDQILKIN
jgi:hypothetical protein